MNFNGSDGNPFQQFRNLGHMNEQLRRLFGPQFFQNILKQMPVQEIESLQNNPNWAHIFGGNLMNNESDGSTPDVGFPKIDVYQTRQEVVAVVEIPGLQSAQDVDINVQADTLTLTGSIERRYSAVREDRFAIAERYRGTFERSVRLPVRVRPAQSRATYNNGLLEIRMTKENRQTGTKRGRSIPLQF